MLFIATRNPHKVGEIRSVLGEEDLAYVTLSALPESPTVAEDAPTFAGNATKKAVELARWITRSKYRAGIGIVSEPGQPCYVLADDSGLEVDALGGAPGVHSARFATLDASPDLHRNSPDAENNAKLLRLLRDVPPEKRTARFRCVIALTPVLEARVTTSSPACSADEFEFQTQLFEGTCEGLIGFDPRGQNGFGYDPLFTPLGQQQTFAELGEAIKNRISHRARALNALKQGWTRTKERIG